MRLGGLAIALVAVGCVRSSTVTCDDGTVCREGTSCFAIQSGGFTCVGEGEVVCGNGRVEDGEACDDGNLLPGDGCSSDCRSDETCDNGVIDPVKRDSDNNLQPNEQCDDKPELAFTSHDGCSSTCMSEAPRWDDRRSLPTARASAVMVTDTLRERIVVFGGAPVRSIGFGSLSNETWEFDGDGWTHLLTSFSPAPRVEHAMAFDGTQIILFGGRGGTLLGDTWALDGNAWTLLDAGSTDAVPSPRSSHAMAFMPGVGVVLFGGNDKQVRNDTWVFANGRWTEVVTATAPPKREKHVMAYDPMRERIVMTGGTGAENLALRDTWEFDGTTWRDVTTTPGPALAEANLVVDRKHGELLLQGGYGYGMDQDIQSMIAIRQTRGDTYRWDGTSWVHLMTVQTGLLEEPQRMEGAAATDPITGEAILFGGGTRGAEGQSCLGPCEDTFRDTWRWSGSVWSAQDFIEFPFRTGAAGAYDPDRRKVVVFGGSQTGLGGNEQQDTYELGAGSWRKVATTGPSVRVDAAMAYGVFGMERAAYLFGGASGATKLGDTWKFAGGAWTRVSATSPLTARSQARMAFDAKRGVIVLYGGVAGGTVLQDTWEFDGTTWTNKMPSGTVPGPRMNHTMAYDPIRQQVLLFGGASQPNVAQGGLWAWSGTEWKQLMATIEPPAREGAGMAWDAARRRMVLFGGDGNDTWEWDGATWSFISMFDPPLPRVSHVLVSSPTGNGVMAIGGMTSAVSRDTLHFVRDSAAPYAACRADLDDDRDTVSGCDDPDCWVVCTPWCPPGATCDAAAPSCGDGMCGAPRENCGNCAADCGACPF